MDDGSGITKKGGGREKKENRWLMIKEEGDEKRERESLEAGGEEGRTREFLGGGPRSNLRGNRCCLSERRLFPLLMYGMFSKCLLPFTRVLSRVRVTRFAPPCSFWKLLSRRAARGSIFYFAGVIPASRLNPSDCAVRSPFFSRLTRHRATPPPRSPPDRVDKIQIRLIRG